MNESPSSRLFETFSQACFQGMERISPEHSSLIKDMETLIASKSPLYNPSPNKPINKLHESLTLAIQQAFDELSSERQLGLREQLSTLESDPISKVKAHECLVDWSQLASSSPAVRNALTTLNSRLDNLLSPPKFEAEETFFSLDMTAPNETIAKSRLKLAVMSGPHEGEIQEVEGKSTVTIGRKSYRGSKAFLSLNKDRKVTPEHCLVIFDPPHCCLRNLSRNGTKVNGIAVHGEQALADGMRLAMGQSEVSVEIEWTTHDTKGSANPAKNVPTTQEREYAVLTSQPFPNVEVVSLLARGGMGEVYLAQEKHTGTFVALKTIRPEMADQTAIRSFLREAKLGARIIHPHAVRIHDGSHVDGVLYFLMEYVPGGNAHDLMRREERPFSPQASLLFMNQIMSAVEYIHSLGLVHRDIKPKNILIAENQKPMYAKLTDFGLMRCYEHFGSSMISKTGESKGTPAFMPPEQVLDAKRAGPTADIYSLGATLHFFLTGHFPLRAKQKSNSLLVILDQDPIPLREHWPEAPKELENTILRCLEKKVADRFQSISELRTAIQSSFSNLQ